MTIADLNFRWHQWVENMYLTIKKKKLEIIIRFF